MPKVNSGGGGRHFGQMPEVPEDLCCGERSAPTAYYYILAMLPALSSAIHSSRITSGPSGVPSCPSSNTLYVPSDTPPAIFRNFRHLAEMSSPIVYFLIRPKM